VSTQEPDQPQFSDEELRAIEAEMQKITVDDVLLQTIVTLLNLAARKAGLAAPPPAEGRGEAGGEASGRDRTPPEPDLEQVKQAIDGARALLPLVEARHGKELGPVKDALARLQMFYAQRASGRAPAGEAPAPEPEQPSGAGPAQSSGRLWVPGQ
jgi:hypothetical protein